MKGFALLLLLLLLLFNLGLCGPVMGAENKNGETIFYRRITMKALQIVLAFLIFSLPQVIWAGGEKTQGAKVAKGVAAVANQLAIRPQTIIDFTAVSGEICFNHGLGKGANMTHFAIDPTRNQEDVIDFVNAKPLIAAGVNVDKLPLHPGTLGSMKPGQWYFLPAGQFEPHHGKKLPIPLMIRASNLE